MPTTITIIIYILLTKQVQLFECSPHENLPLEQLKISSSESSEETAETVCEDELSEAFCENVVNSGSCSEASDGCQKSCGFCSDDDEAQPQESQNQNETGNENANVLNDEGGCEDKIPNCSSYLSMCCSMKDAMNTSCPKTCKFCSETPSAPDTPGGIAAPTAATDQDPCSPENPPSVTVDAPGQTTTTQAPITAGTFPGISIDGSIPGQTTTTTQASITGPGGLPGNPVG